MKKLIVLLGVLTVENAALAAGSFDVLTGQTLGTAQALAAGQTGVVEQGGTLTLGGATVAVTVTGNATITNSGSITQTGTGRGIRDNTGGLTLTVNNLAGALISAFDGDVIQMNKANSNIYFNNYGTLTSTNNSAGGSQAIDFAAITTGVNQLHNYATGIITANEADAVRPGVNGVVINEGLIKSTRNAGSTSGTDGIDAQTNSGISISNSGTVEGARHGITGGPDASTSTGAFALSIVNQAGGVITGANGSGINVDGVNALEVVTINNAGSITGNGLAADGDGVDVDGLVNLTNSGIIKSTQANGDVSEGVTVGGGSIVNSGTIEGDNINGGIGRGITLAGLDKDPITSATIPVQGIYADTTITNSGLIKGQTDSAIAMTGANSGFTVTINNQAGGTLEGGGSAAVVAAGAQTTHLINAGVIKADGTGKAVDFGSSDSSLQIVGGAASISGDLDGGSGNSTLSIVPGAGNSFVYADNISRFASLSVGAGTTILDGNTQIAGLTSVSGGVLQIGDASHASAVLAGNVQVAADGTLGGHGSVVGNVINAGIVRPGGSIGTLTINGNYSQSASGTLLIDVSPSGASQLKVNGAANLGGTLQLLYGPGTYTASTFNVLSANSVSGSFANVSSNVPTGMTQSVAVSGTGVNLVLQGAATATPTPAPTPTPSPAPSPAPAPTPVVIAPTNANLFGAMASSSLLQTQRLADAVLQARHASGAPGEVNGWMQAEGQNVRTDANSGAPGYKDEHFGLIAGADTQKGGWTLGDAISYGHSRVEENDTGNSGKIDTLALTGYAQTDTASGVQLAGTLGAGYSWLSSTRQFATLGNATADAHAYTLGGALQAGLPSALTAAWTLTPRLGARYALYHGQAFSESGPTSQNLNVQAATLHSMQPFAGIAINYAAGEGSRKAQLQASLDYAYETGSASRAMTVASQDGTRFVIPGTETERGLVTAGIGIQYPLGAALDVYLNYQGIVKTGNVAANAANAGLKYRF
ncbi:autotransporter family protein [Amantichitinum ursilacus]|uniref:Autotransporter beta-domain protein n=1 Tax=Amantichitinum ursilacus TaxID=857265 RepID=A0A0N0XJH8_9NEIS|nr:autotransporter outer membrane beta-barrel domain-containing protein [Amantichitinum ursilacus]KPC53826.1 Autotransporter beta-domain protein [Amantichitinum ursilacus]